MRALSTQLNLVHKLHLKSKWVDQYYGRGHSNILISLFGNEEGGKAWPCVQTCLLTKKCKRQQLLYRERGSDNKTQISVGHIVTLWLIYIWAIGSLIVFCVIAYSASHLCCMNHIWFISVTIRISLPVSQSSGPLSTLFQHHCSLFNYRLICVETNNI